MSNPRGIHLLMQERVKDGVWSAVWNNLEPVLWARVELVIWGRTDVMENCLRNVIVQEIYNAVDAP